ncbi:MAG TPA: MBL fold metallo-hydrolase, partial [Tepidiformaceae bacterium]|nr:MBL fold metallo-hydrolase [Tepidiformaceae bacterium]
SRFAHHARVTGGMAMQVSASVRAVQVPDENPMHPDYTSIYVVGKDQVLTIDSGETLERYQWMLRGYLAATERAEIALAGITHHHMDHSGNLKFIQEAYNAEVIVPKDAVPLLTGKLPKKRTTFTDEEKVIDLGAGTRVRVMRTPGHSVDSLCYYIEEEGVLFSGDTILGSSTTTVNDLGDYRRSLAKLLELPNLKVMCPGHGPLIHDPRERIQQYITHRTNRERQILSVLGEGGEMTSWDIMMKVYGETIDKRLRRAAEGNVRSHLSQLEAEGRLKVYEGKPKRPNAAKQQRDIEHAKYRDSVKAQAKKFETEDRRKELRAQENPASAQWSVMPKYELVGSARD